MRFIVTFCYRGFALSQHGLVPGQERLINSTRCSLVQDPRNEARPVARQSRDRV